MSINMDLKFKINADKCKTYTKHISCHEAFVKKSIISHERYFQLVHLVIVHPKPLPNHVRIIAPFSNANNWTTILPANEPTHENALEVIM